MFNSTKQDDLKDKATQLANGVKTNVEAVGNAAENVKTDMQNSAKEALDLVHTQAETTKAQAIGVIESLKSLLNQYTSGANVNEIKDQILDKASQLKNIVKDEASHAYEVSRDKTVQTVQDKPIVSLAVAVGAGVLLGYILGSKTNAK